MNDLTKFEDKHDFNIDIEYSKEFDMIMSEVIITPEMDTKLNELKAFVVECNEK